MDGAVLHTSLCDLLEIEHPIFLAGMASKGNATPPGLVAAVSNAGGLGACAVGVGGADAVGSPEPESSLVTNNVATTVRPITTTSAIPPRIHFAPFPLRCGGGSHGGCEPHEGGC